MDFTFDIRDLIGPPYRACQKCGDAQFGVISINGNSYARRCKKCNYGQTYPLWPLKKKVIYIDQFAISNMMKVLDAAASGHTRAVAEPFWLDLFEALERVGKLQLATCPSSDTHTNESLVMKDFDALKRMYEQLSHGVSFAACETISRRQLAVAVRAWIRNETPNYDFNPSRITDGGLNDWRDRVIISAKIEYPLDMVDDIRKRRDEVHEGSVELFKSRLAQKGKDFDHWLGIERASAGPVLAEAYGRAMARLAKIMSGEDLQDYESHGLSRFLIVKRLLQEEGDASIPLQEMMKAFFDSDTFIDFPSSHIESLLWANLGHQASAGGRTKPPNRGMVNDMTTVAALLPYCDAMFVDNECRNLIQSIPGKHKLAYETQIFSLSNRDEFLAYLAGLEKDADDGVLECVREVYGDSWQKPYLEMYEERGKAEPAPGNATNTI